METKKKKKERNHKSNMRKSMKDEVVLGPCEIQATRLNRLEYRRLQRNITLLDVDVQHHIAQLHRQAQDLRYHFTNVVRVVKTNRVCQSCKQAHIHEIAQNEAKNFIGLIVHKNFNIIIFFIRL